MIRKAVERFQRELRLLTDERFQHPGIIKLLAYTTDDNPWYISSLGTPFIKYWDEQSKRLESQLDQLALLAVKQLAQILEGLALLHEAGVIHRDIKPANTVTIDSTSGGVPQAALIGFWSSF
ncbi:MAG: protein kinase [Acidobacteria bacterium]|nr:protein kinase [Acidobacteriota bacterium]